MQEGKWLLLGLAILLVLFLTVWRMAITLNEGTQVAPHRAAVVGHADKDDSIQVAGGQLVAEIPERKERWVLEFKTSHYDTKKQVAITKDGICQVTRKGQVVTVFQAPTIFVRFKDRKMEMGDGVTIVALIPKLRVNLQTLKWHWETGQLVGVGAVKIEGERISSVADRLEGDTTLQQISLIGNIHLNWNTKGGEQK